MSGRMCIAKHLVGACALLALIGVGASAGSQAPDGWQTETPDHGVAPEFSREKSGGPDGGSALVIRASGDTSVPGYWSRVFPVESGKHYRFTAYRKTQRVPTPARSAVVKIEWLNEQGKPVVVGDDQVLNAESDRARPVFPADRGTTENGWTEVRETYRVPEGATAAKVELQLRWAPGGSVRWADVSFRPTGKPTERRVRLAAVHYRPKGNTPAENREQFAPLIARAAERRADLVVLGECLTYLGTGGSYAAVAEPVPGPSTEYFGKLAKKHDLYIVAGLIEKAGDHIYNVSVLMGPDGELVGKYRKVCLPRSEIDGGITPGTDYPVFDTRLGRVGMMICWDVHFPEVARGLANNGAEIIAMPIWGGMPDLAKARAIENQIYLVTSTYTSHNKDWMKSAVWDYAGRRLTTANEWGTVVVREVNLDAEKHWDQIGDFKGRIPREKPATGPGG